jgi:hypothetical protein
MNQLEELSEEISPEQLEEILELFCETIEEAMGDQ